MDRLNLPAGILKELAMQRMKHRVKPLPGANVQECVDYLQKEYDKNKPPEPIPKTKLQLQIEKIKKRLKIAA